MSKASRSVLITGGTGDLGRCCALEIAKKYPQHRIIITGRSDSKGVTQKINTATGKSNVEFLQLDLSSLKSTRDFAQRYAAKGYPPLITLLLNAALQLPGALEYTEDGLETSAGVNYVAHTLLFHLLTPHLAEGARIVLLSSGTHDPAQKTPAGKPEYFDAEEFVHPTAKTKTNTGLWRYGVSKLAIVLWTYALHRRLATGGGMLGNNWTAVVVDPGLMPGTGLARSYSGIQKFMWDHVLPRARPLIRAFLYANTRSPKEAGESLAWLAMEAQSKDIAGQYYEGRKPGKSSEASHNVEHQEDLWRWTVQFVAKDDAERQSFDKLAA